MPVKRFWGSVWAVAAYLFTVSITIYIVELLFSIVALLGQLFRLPAAEPVAAVAMLATAAVPLLVTLAYLDWRWSWKPEHIGMARSGKAAGLGLLGLLLGAVGAFLTYQASSLLEGNRLDLALPHVLSTDVTGMIALLVGIVTAVNVEIMFRGAATSRYQADLSQQEIWVAAILTPLAVALLNMIFPILSVPTGITSLWTAAVSIFLTLLYLRTDSVWLSAGLHAGLVGTLQVLGLRTTSAGGLAVWGTAAAVLLLLELMRQQRMPKRVSHGRGPQRGGYRGRTVRGPWGPH